MADYKQKMAMANALMSQGQAAQPTEQYGALAKVLQMGLGSYMGSKASDERNKSLQQALSAQDNNAMLAALGQTDPETALAIRQQQIAQESKSKAAAQQKMMEMQMQMQMAPMLAAAKAKAELPFEMQKIRAMADVRADSRVPVPGRDVPLSPEVFEQQRQLAQMRADMRPMTEGQTAAAGYADRMASAAGDINKFQEQGTDWKQALASSVPAMLGGNYLVSPEKQQLEQAERNFVNALLRRESGAAISESEFENARKQYFPQPGDSPEMIEQKRRNREITMSGVVRAAGPQYQQAATVNAPAATVNAPQVNPVVGPAQMPQPQLDGAVTQQKRRAFNPATGRIE